MRTPSQLVTILILVAAVGSSSCRPLPPPKRVTTNIGLKLTYIPPGSFTMGAEPSELGAKPAEKQHKVTISKGFYMGIHEVTQDQYLRVLGSHWAGLLDHQFSDVPHCHRPFSLKIRCVEKLGKTMFLLGKQSRDAFGVSHTI
jgi:hypothetical protein